MVREKNRATRFMRKKVVIFHCPRNRIRSSCQAYTMEMQIEHTHTQEWEEILVNQQRQNVNYEGQTVGS